MGAARTICLLSRPGFVSLQDDEEALADFLGIDIIVRPAEQLARGRRLMAEGHAMLADALTFEALALYRAEETRLRGW